TFLREVICGASYLSGNDLRLTFGLGNTSHIDNLKIRWHNGKIQQLGEIPMRQSITFSQH
ncbi:MAG: ASPIC/UnbV domain-containing protein, partial [Candidatus Poribacteria bacterium]|nr:ASPIC/UnbV domain-containing protein [Candidatus Poribacteria bacterium]